MTMGPLLWMRDIFPYDSYHSSCHRGHSVDYRSFITYECEKAVNDGLKIVVIYNYASIDKSKCPEAVKHVGNHVKAYTLGMDGKYYWNYDGIKAAIMG